LKLGKELPDNIINSRSACLSHAEDLIRSAKRILADEKLPNISYHLGVLALEEIGKSTLIVMGHFANQSDDTGWNPQNFYDDHVKKLFWATWDPSFGREKITKDQIESFQGLSRKIHDTRLQGLYVDFDDKGPFLPSEAISESEAENLINVATARLEMEKLRQFGEIEDNNLESMSWFLTATSDGEKRKLIFGNKSMEKLAELGSTNKRVAWLKQEFEKAEKEAQEAIKQEIDRKPPTAQEKDTEKWKIKIRFFTNSHSIRPKPLNKWNELSSWVKLYPVGGKKNQLLAEFTLPKSISVHQLWWAGWGVARKFIVALNIGTLGCFWWYVPEQISRYYEKVTDLEAKDIDVRIERSPSLKLDWKRSALSEQELINTALCFGMLPGDNESTLGQSMGAYVTALAFLNKNDIHWQFEMNAYELFYKSLKLAKKHFKEWDGKSHFIDHFVTILTGHKIDQLEIEKHKKIAENVETHPPSTKGVTLSEVGVVKIICDAYLLLKFREVAETRKPKN
jgi:AbiV family abortive infection protein